MKKTKLAATLMVISLTGVANAHQAGDWLVRAGATQVAPDESSGNVFVAGVDLGVGVNVDSNTQLGLNFVYFVDNHWAIELLAATPFKHDIGLNTVGELGSTKHLPPTLTANYYFSQSGAAFQPYIGAGINYTIFFDEEFTAANDSAGFADLSLDNSWGLSAQVGFDYQVDARWHINASVRWIDIDTEATFSLGGAEGSVDVDIDPYVYTLSVGYRF